MMRRCSATVFRAALRTVHLWGPPTVVSLATASFAILCFISFSRLEWYICSEVYLDDCNSITIVPFVIGVFVLLCLLISLFIKFRSCKIVHSRRDLDAIYAMFLVHMSFQSLLGALILQGIRQHVENLAERYSYRYQEYKGFNYDAYIGTFIMGYVSAALCLFYGLLILSRAFRAML